MTKKIKKLEKETTVWRTKWENNNKALLQMAEEVCIISLLAVCICIAQPTLSAKHPKSNSPRDAFVKTCFEMDPEHYSCTKFVISVY